MSFWKWIRAYWQGYAVLITTPEKHYRIFWLKGNMRMTTEIVEIRGATLDRVWYDESPQEKGERRG